jgi:putative GTP pyrophosphokinase
MLNAIMDDWEKEYVNYRLLCEHIEKILKEQIKNQGIIVKIDFRVKDPINLAQKLIKEKLDNQKKGINTSLENLYSSLSDKAGLRIICRYNDEIIPITEIIKAQFDIINEDNKIVHLDYNQMGYKSYHLDIKLKNNDVANNQYQKLEGLRAEVQVRTLCENVWAEIDHDIGYKPTSDVQYDIRRQIHCLGGLFEVADDSLSRINKSVVESTIITEEYLLRKLEPIFVKYFKMEYDRDFSLRSLEALKPILNTSSPKEFEQSFTMFVTKNEDLIRFFANHYSFEKIPNPYISQPEILLIFYLLKIDKHSLIEKWQEEFFIEDLEKIGVLWGIPISSILEE